MNPLKATFTNSLIFLRYSFPKMVAPFGNPSIYLSFLFQVLHLPIPKNLGDEQFSLCFGGDCWTVVIYDSRENPIFHKTAHSVEHDQPGSIIKCTFNREELTSILKDYSTHLNQVEYARNFWSDF